MEEASFGLSIAKFFGDEILNPFFVRLPFAILGILSVFVFYSLLCRFGESFKFSYLSSLLLTLTPWHIQESRIVSKGILLTFILILLALIFSKQLKSRTKLLTYSAFLLSTLLFVATLLISLPKVSDAVDIERQEAANVISVKMSRVFSNKAVESYRKNVFTIYEHLDYGVYFFNGHPRQRWGVEETQKLFISFIPLIIIGIIKLRNNKGLLLGVLFIFLVTLFTFLEYRDPSETLPLVFIFVFFSASGLTYLLNKKENLKVFYILLLILGYEFFNFNVIYFLGLSESTFSPRRPVYEDLVKNVNHVRRNDEKVLVNERLLKPKIFFQFYLKDPAPNDFEFRNYNVWNEDDKNVLFVDVLPFEPSPTESLYTKEGNFPEKLTFLYEINDEQLKQTVFIYRYDKN